jgi:hypothetical protein
MAHKLQAKDELREIVKDSPTYRGQVCEYSNDKKEDSWLTTSFKCQKHMDHASGGDGADGQSTDDYRVMDRRPAVAIESDTRNTHHTGMIWEKVGGITNEYDKGNAFCYSRHNLLSYDPDS